MYRHIKLGPEDLPDVEDFRSMVVMPSAAAGGAAGGDPSQPFKRARTVVNSADGTSIELYKVSLCRYFTEQGSCRYGGACVSNHSSFVCVVPLYIIKLIFYIC